MVERGSMKHLEQIEDEWSELNILWSKRALRVLLGLPRPCRIPRLDGNKTDDEILQLPVARPMLVVGVLAKGFHRAMGGDIGEGHCAICAQSSDPIFDLITLACLCNMEGLRCPDPPQLDQAPQPRLRCLHH